MKRLLDESKRERYSFLFMITGRAQINSFSTVSIFSHLRFLSSLNSSLNSQERGIHFVPFHSPQFFRWVRYYIRYFRSFNNK